MKNEEILRRAQNLWNKAPKFKPWRTELDSGTVVIGFVGKVSKHKKVIHLQYVTRRGYAFQEVYFFKTNQNLYIKFYRDEVRWFKGLKWSQEEVINHLIDVLREDSFSEELKEDARGLDKNPEYYKYETNVRRRDVDPEILKHLMWSEREGDFSVT